MIKFSFSKDRLIDDPTVATVSFVSSKDSQVVLLPTGQKSISIGVDDRKKVTRRRLILLARQVITLAKANKIKRLAIDFSDLSFPRIRISDREKAELLATNFEMANFEFTKYKSPPPEGWNAVEEIIVYGRVTVEIRKGFKTGQTIADEVNSCRILSNTPGGEMTPKLLATEAQKAVQGLPIKVTVLAKTEIKKLKMGGVLGVSQGSSEEPRFIILEYKGGGKSKKPIVLVGKGVTFDTGGISLKPSKGAMIEMMQMDMSGGAAVIHTLSLAAKLKIRKNIIGLVPAVENMPSGSSYRPGDILRSMSGKTIEVMNTDAEGRIILADALTYAKKYDPALVIDVATLTGAAVVALGERASALFVSDEKLHKTFQSLGEESGDYVWPMPLWEEYEDEIKGTFGDVSNIGKTSWGGAITAATFLHQFAKDYKWVHIDIAPRMISVEGEHLAKGAAGAGVRLLIKVLGKL